MPFLRSCGEERFHCLFVGGSGRVEVCGLYKPHCRINAEHWPLVRRHILPPRPSRGAMSNATAGPSAYVQSDSGLNQALRQTRPNLLRCRSFL